MTQSDITLMNDIDINHYFKFQKYKIYTINKVNLKNLLGKISTIYNLKTLNFTDK